jgi:hypothetical protein
MSVVSPRLSPSGTTVAFSAGMATCGASGGNVGTGFPTLWRGTVAPSRFGDAAILFFLVTQCLDGVLTYIGVMTYGVAGEGNPILAALMERLGHATALLMAKLVSAGLGIMLHLLGVHSAVALLTLFYMAAAVMPWAAILFVLR